MGSVNPGLGYFRALTDNEEQAIEMKGRHDAARQSRSESSHG